MRGMTPSPAMHPRAGRIHRHVQRAGEHAGIEFAGRAVDVAIGAGETGGDQGRAQAGHAGEQLIDKGVFRAAQGQGVQPARCHQAGGIDPARMGRGEDKGQALAGRPCRSGRARHRAGPGRRRRPGSRRRRPAAMANSRIRPVRQAQAGPRRKPAAQVRGSARPVVNRSLRFAGYRF